MENNGSLVYTVRETAKLLHLSRNSVYLGILTKEIPHVKVGKRILIPKAALEQFLNATHKRPEN
jgi:excisionase family DNA binding protein